ncbi:MAG: DUF3820 family protein [Parachlamydiales bacterium]|nr:DUF3820 family protein [Parachlamydiales bacterium]
MSKRPIYYDTETTGIDSKNDRIIEIAAYDPVLDKTFNKLINPKMNIPPESTQIHNITDEMVKDADTFEIVGKEFINFCEGETILIAHNNDSFDKYFLENEFTRNNITIPNFTYIDSLKWARKYRPDLPRHSLQYLRQIYNVEANQAHRALDDVIVLYKVFDKMIDDLPIETVLELLNKTKEELLLVMPFGKHQGKKLQDVPKNYFQWLLKNDAFEKEENKILKKSLIKLNLI